MIWHETADVAVIIMLTPIEEGGRPKCFQYFPLDAESSPLIVKASGYSDHPEAGEIAFVESFDRYGSHTQVRKLHLTFASQTKVVWHLFFTAIADFGVPEVKDRPELLELIKLSTEKNTNQGNPRIVHCSAGVGRSGTFIALEHLISQLGSGTIQKAKLGDDPIFDVVQQLREQRMMMVQSEVQYQFLYEVLADEFQKQQASMQMSGQPSPKLRKLGGGMKVATLDETDYLNNFGDDKDNPEITINYSQPGPLSGDDHNANSRVAPTGLQFEESLSDAEKDTDSVPKDKPWLGSPA